MLRASRGGIVSAGLLFPAPALKKLSSIAVPCSAEGELSCLTISRHSSVRCPPASAGLAGSSAGGGSGAPSWLEEES